MTDHSPKEARQESPLDAYRFSADHSYRSDHALQSLLRAFDLFRDKHSK